MRQFLPRLAIAAVSNSPLPAGVLARLVTRGEPLTSENGGSLCARKG